jgi:2-methylaconitate cis-trans-isomerase PrpF
MPSEGYTTSNGETIGANSADILVRAISSGDVHATIPGTTLAAINVGGGIKGSLIQELIGGEEGKKDVVTVRCCHAAGVATSSARFVSNSQGKRGPVSVVLMRTAREIMRGQILFSKRVLD